MVEVANLERDGATFARLAVDYDQQANCDLAVFYYTEAAQALLNAKLSGSQKSNLAGKANEYILRCEALKSLAAKKAKERNLSVAVKSKSQMGQDRAKFLILQAFEEDKSGNVEDAVELYGEAVEMCLQLGKLKIDEQSTASFNKLAAQALDRAEALKSPAPANKLPVPTLPRPTNTLGPLGLSLRDSSPTPLRRGGVGGVSPKGPSAGGYTKEEISVLRATSLINGREYVPFMPGDRKERFAYPMDFSDKHGKLALSQKQREELSGWVRVAEFVENPRMIYLVSAFSIRQTIVTDCSFVASLAISAQYERRFQKKLITSIIYPQNSNGDPVINPCGKYMVKLHLNGVPRKVVVDDYLPSGRDGRLLCSFSTNREEMWVSILEKAYMKVMGGYDFPGSNSNIDLHALTSWIPDRFSLQGETEAVRNQEFEKIRDRFHKGHCLVTAATGNLAESDADRAGLVPTHAYALLDIRMVEGQRLLMLKNPWSHLRWKGRFSENDETSWTPAMQRALAYDLKRARDVDNGVFWIDYSSFCKFYDVIYINWSPELFPHTTCMHHTWAARSGPAKDLYNVGENPQYQLGIRASVPSAVWILLTRHITDKDDFANNREFIGVNVYEGSGNRVYYPHSPSPYQSTVRINSPHCLCKLSGETGQKNFTLVISQYEKKNTIHYTLRVYGTCPISLKKIEDPYTVEKQIDGEWRGKTAGGCGNYRDTFNNNPVYQLKLDNSHRDNQLLVELKAPQKYSVGLLSQFVSDPNAASQNSGSYKSGYCYLQLQNVEGGLYNIMPSTYKPGEEGPFVINVSSKHPFTYTRIR